MEKIMDAMLYTLGSSVIVLPIFYLGTLQLMKYKKEIVTTSMDQFTNSLFGNIFRPPLPVGVPTATPISLPEKKSTEITSFFLKKRGV